MSFNRGVLNAYREIDCRTLNVVTGSSGHSGSATISGSLFVAGPISGSSYVGVTVSAGVSSLLASGSSPIIQGAITFTGSGGTVISQGGQVITFSGSTSGVLGIGASGSSSLTGNVYLTGSGSNIVSQTGQVITIFGNLSNVLTSIAASGSSNISGSAAYLTGSGTVSVSESGTLITISGSPTSGVVTSITSSGSSPVLTGNIVLTGSDATTISQSGQAITISGSSNATLLSGLNLSQVRTHAPASHAASHTTGGGDAVSIYKSQVSDLQTSPLIIPSFSASGSTATSGVSGSLTVVGTISGSTYQGPVSAHASTHVYGGTDALAGNFVFTNLTATNVTGSSTVSTANAYVTNLSGSGNVSGSTLQGELSASRVVLSGSTYHLDQWVHPQDNSYMSGSRISGSIDANARVGVRQNSGGVSYNRRRINFVQGPNISYTIGEDAVNEEVDVTITSNTGSGELPARYIIWSGSNTYYAQNGHTGNIDYSGTSATYVINSAINTLTNGRTWMETVFLKGDFVITGSILIPSYTHFILDGLITLASSSNCIMIQNAHTGSGDSASIIEGGTLDGNRNNNSGTSPGIYWYNTTTPSSIGYIENRVTIHDITIRYCRGDSIHLYAEPAQVTDFVLYHIATYSSGYGIYLDDIADAYVTDCLQVDGDNGGMYINNCNMMEFHNLYVNNGVFVNNSILNTFSQIRIDTRTVNGLTLTQCKWSNFENLRIHKFGSDGNTSAFGISLGSTSIENQFNTVYIGRGNGTGTNRFGVGVQETSATSDYNTYININTRDALTYGIVLSGSNSHLSHCWDQTTWRTGS